jgi:hypothetical protein
MLWRPGAWVHMKRPACGPVVVQQRPRPFDATGAPRAALSTSRHARHACHACRRAAAVPPPPHNCRALPPPHRRRTPPCTAAAVTDASDRNAWMRAGYGVEARRIPAEHSVFPAEKYAFASSAAELQGGTPDALTTVARIARERTERNPQMFVDDVAPTLQATRAAVSDAGAAFAAIDAQEAKLTTAFPELPLRIGNAPTYSSGLQRTAMATPSAAATLYPMLEPPPADALSRLLSVQPKTEEPPPPEPEPDAAAKGKKK